jgi:quercetin 2,3-dioxygenase
MTETRTVSKVLKGRPTLEGAGVHLKRAFGFPYMPQLDPFLLLDDFHSANPADYRKGFPWHPHRGIETISYMLEGEVEHGDSLGNRGVIAAGDVQWMTAGSGIVHQEMPRGQSDGRLWGFQLWANLPAAQKMMDPHYRDVKAHQIPVIRLESGAQVRLICGSVGNMRGPVQDIVIDPEYLDVSVPPQAAFSHAVHEGYTVFAYVIEGQGYFDPARDKLVGNENLVLFGDGGEVTISTAAEAVRFLLISGKPLREPVAWYGPIVMNTQEELEVAFQEYERGTFLKHRP